MRSSEQINELAAALSKAQGQMKAAKKTEDNLYFKSKYADLANVIENDRKALADNGLSVVQGAGTVFGPAGAEAVAMAVSVCTRLIHTSGQWIEETLLAVPKDFGPQTVGACVTYLRRYGYCAIVKSTAEGEDDDGEVASGRGNGKGFNPNAALTEPKEKAKEAPEPTVNGEVEAARAALNATYKKCGGSGPFTTAELEALKAVASEKRDSLASLTDLNTAWAIELNERIKAKKETE